MARNRMRGWRDETKPGGERLPAVAGLFYPAEQGQLAATIDALLAGAGAPLGPAPIGLVAPHAGYAFAGPIMAEAWSQARRHTYDLLVLLGANHFDPAFDRISVWTGGAWMTPFGRAAVDAATAAALLAVDPLDCAERPECHAEEHSLEVHVPWAQRLFPEVPILPIVVATADLSAIERFSRELVTLVRPRRTLILASSDLSHYPSRADAPAVDQATLAAIAELNPLALCRAIAGRMQNPVPRLATCACGEGAVLAAMATARKLGAGRGEIVAYANSGDAEDGDAARVVGYGAVSFTA